MDKSKNWLVVGLGLLGGKYAQVLSAAGYRVYGIDADPAAVDFARSNGYIADGATENFDALVKQADCIVFGLYPATMLEWAAQYGNLIRPGAYCTDVSGVKRGFAAPMQKLLPAGVHFIASHPMAGRETSGVAHSAEVDFRPANFIITPTPANTAEEIAWCRALAKTLGFRHITRLTPEEHDHMIGYVSQLCHAIAVSLMCASDNTAMAEYTGDSFRDLTRIARINDKMWAELFLLNKDNLIAEIEMFSASMQQLRGCLETGDRQGLEEMFRLSTKRRAAFDKRQTNCRDASVCPPSATDE